jgi:cytochrome c peroxidase
MHTGKEIGIDEFQASRSPGRFINGKEVGGYRTSPLKGLWAHQKGGFFHDGRFATLLEVVDHYNDFFKLHLTEQQKGDLVEYLKSL